ncbi:hypothetical protein PF003_g39157 [Phytophthora fragariae]|nr:hypothetical protein PF003_g39157 [Phytophthora fragariae]
MSLGVLTAVRGMSLSHQDLIEAVCQIDRAVDDAARHGVEDHVLPRNGRLCGNGGIVQLVECMDDAPPASRLLHAERRTRVRRDTLSHVASVAAAFEEVIDGLNLIPRQWPLPRHAVLRPGHEVDLVPDTSLSRKFRRNLLGEDVFELACKRVYGVARVLEGLPRLGSEACLANGLQLSRLRSRRRGIVADCVDKHVGLVGAGEDAYLLDLTGLQVAQEMLPGEA